jgi:hypothetical protein
MLRVIVTVGAAALLAAGCGSMVVEPGIPALDGGALDGAFEGGASLDAGDAATGDASRDAAPDADARVPGDADAARDATDIRDARPDAPLPDVFQLPDAPPVLEDAGCADAGTRPSRVTCDAYAQTGCPAGQGCYPFTIPPRGPCDVETYGTACRPTGSGTQGQPCSARGCSAGYVCIVGSGGETCAQLCDLTQSGQCPRGLTCQPVDVSGFGVCA